MSDSEKDYASKISKLEVEIHTVNSSFSEFKDEMKHLVGKLFTKLDEHTTKKPIGIGVIIASVGALISMLAILLGGMVWIISSMLQPNTIQLNQLASIVTAQNNNIMTSASKIELTNMQVSGNTKQIENVNDTIQWILYQENIPKQVSEMKRDIEYIKVDMNRLIDNVHKK